MAVPLLPGPRGRPATPVSHPSAETLEALGLGQLDEATAAQVPRHLEGCPACRRAGAALPTSLDKPRDAHGRSGTPAPASPLSWSTNSPQESRPTGSPPPAVPNLPPELLNHPQYEILRQLGGGAAWASSTRRGTSGWIGTRSSR
jgi:hypothetical protein